MPTPSQSLYRFPLAALPAIESALKSLAVDIDTGYLPELFGQPKTLIVFIATPDVPVGDAVRALMDAKHGEPTSNPRRASA